MFNRVDKIILSYVNAIFEDHPSDSKQINRNEWKYTEGIKKHSFVPIAVIIWTIVFYIYIKYLNNYLRNNGYRLNWRTQFSIATWNLFITLANLMFLFILRKNVISSQLAISIMKSYYLFYTGLLIFINHSLLIGYSILLLVVFIFIIPRQEIKYPLRLLFFYKLIDFLFLEICRILYLRYPKGTRKIFKVIRSIYLLYWSYEHLIFVPKNLFWYYECRTVTEATILCLWFIITIFDFMWRYIKSHNLETFLFPEPSQHIIYLTNMIKKPKIVEKRKPHKSSVMKQELWQTLICAMTMKKKINRLRRNKQQKAELNLSKKESEEKEEKKQ